MISMDASVNPKEQSGVSGERSMLRLISIILNVCRIVRSVTYG
jgi:hypothetical protein